VRPLVCGVSAGHGGEDLGATWPLRVGDAPLEPGALVESRLNLDLSNALLTIPTGDALAFVPIRLGDDDLQLDIRNSMAKQLGCDLVIELHHNSLPTNPAAHGSLALWYKGSAKAGHLALEIATKMPPPLRPARAVMVEPHFLGDDKPEAYPRARHVLEAYSAPTLVVEVAYLSNVSDREYLRKPTSAAEIAAGIHAGLMQAPAVWSIR